MKTKTLQRLAYAAFGANLLMQLVAAAPAFSQTTTVTTQRDAFGGWQTTIQRGPRWNPMVQGDLPPAPPNGCDRAGRAAFEIVSGQGAGDCVNASQRQR